VCVSQTQINKYTRGPHTISSGERPARGESLRSAAERAGFARGAVWLAGRESFYSPWESIYIHGRYVVNWQPVGMRLQRIPAPENRSAKGGGGPRLTFRVLGRPRSGPRQSRLGPTRLRKNIVISIPTPHFEVPGGPANDLAIMRRRLMRPPDRPALLLISDRAPPMISFLERLRWYFN